MIRPRDIDKLLLFAFLCSITRVSTFLQHSKTSGRHTGPCRYRRNHGLGMTGLFGEQVLSNQTVDPSIEWKIYIDYSKLSLDRGASLTLDAFFGMCPPSKVQVIPAILPKSNKKAPWVRIISTAPGMRNIDVANVDSVDKVYRILKTHLRIEDVSPETWKCLKWKYKGNGHLEGGKVDQAIDAYDRALQKCRGSKQEGVILLLRADAYSQQAHTQKQALRQEMDDWNAPSPEDVKYLLAESLQGGPQRIGLGNSILRKLNSDGKIKQAELKKLQYRHGLYQYSLLHATRDTLRATEILPKYPNSWLQAAESLCMLWKLKESRQYYEKALSLDPSLEQKLKPMLEDLNRRQSLLDRARSNDEWPEDFLRLALDVAG